MLAAKGLSGYLLTRWPSRLRPGVQLRQRAWARSSPRDPPHQICRLVRVRCNHNLIAYAALPHSLATASVPLFHSAPLRSSTLLLRRGLGTLWCCGFYGFTGAA